MSWCGLVLCLLSLIVGVCVGCGVLMLLILGCCGVGLALLGLGCCVVCERVGCRRGISHCLF